MCTAYYYPNTLPRYRRYARSLKTVRFPNDVLFQDHIRQGDLEQVGRFIRARKVTLDTIYPCGMAALHEAVLSGNLDCVKLLVKYGADINQKDEDGWTPLHMACSDGHADIARSEMPDHVYLFSPPLAQLCYPLSKHRLLPAQAGQIGREEGSAQK
uniref:Protein phosphatase 1 regulatory subunit 27 n=1 Tax=Varanus komodoensis TaxID=61221 RepID=A0A8D2IX28_VARKO